MTNPDEFPLAGTWSVNQWYISQLLFITESRGDGTGKLVRLNPDTNHTILEAHKAESEIKAELEQICLRHNEALREEEG